jgi:phosphatidylglycerophosphate synthase
VTDPTSHDPLARALAWVHPIWMTLSLGLAVATARSGLRMRSARRNGRRRDPRARARHLRSAKLAVPAVAIGWIGGPLSIAALRGRTPFGTVHAWVATTALVFFGATWLLGRRLERGPSRPLDAHALTAALALLLAGVAAVTGFVLLP